MVVDGGARVVVWLLVVARYTQSRELRMIILFCIEVQSNSLVEPVVLEVLVVVMGLLQSVLNRSAVRPVGHVRSIIGSPWQEPP